MAIFDAVAVTCLGVDSKPFVRAGFEITVDHPHTHIVRTCQLVKGQCLLPPSGRGNYPQRCSHDMVER